MIKLPPYTVSLSAEQFDAKIREIVSRKGILMYGEIIPGNEIVARYYMYDGALTVASLFFDEVKKVRTVYPAAMTAEWGNFLDEVRAVVAR